jgi:hypothetical protein
MFARDRGVDAPADLADIGKPDAEVQQQGVVVRLKQARRDAGLV